MEKRGCLFMCRKRKGNVQKEVSEYVNWLLDEIVAGRFPTIEEPEREEVERLIGVGYEDED